MCTVLYCSHTALLTVLYRLTLTLRSPGPLSPGQHGHTLKMDPPDKVRLEEVEMDRVGVVEMDLVSIHIQYLNGKTVTGVCRSDDLTQNIRFTDFRTEVFMFIHILLQTPGLDKLQSLGSRILSQHFRTWLEREVLSQV